VQHFVVVPLQSESAAQTLTPAFAGSQTLCAPGLRDLSTHAWPIVVSHLLSVVQKIGHVVADWHTLPPVP
jgi:hypothetical protein